MKRILMLILVAMLSLTACANNSEEVESSELPTETETNTFLEDLNYFHKTLEENHKNLYANISKEAFSTEINKIAEQTPTMDTGDFYFSLKYLLSMLGDAHTSAYFTEAPYEYLDALGFAIQKFDDSWHLIMLEQVNEQYLGDKLLSINNIDISEIFDKAKSIMSYENEAKAETLLSNTINFKEALEYLKITEEDEPIILQAEDSSGVITDIEIKPMNEEEIMAADIIRFQPEAAAQTGPNGIYRAMTLDANTFFIQYNSCMEDPDLSMESFVSMVKGELTTTEYQDIIIDLRYNGGGNSAIFEPMIDMLQTQQGRQGFNVYTLVGSNTFSSAIINALQIKEQLDTILVGTATGGNVNHYGEVLNFQLNHSPLQINYSTKYFEFIEDYEKDSLYPDIEVKQLFESYVKGYDVEIELIKSLA